MSWLRWGHGWLGCQYNLKEMGGGTYPAIELLRKGARGWTNGLVQRWGPGQLQR